MDRLTLTDLEGWRMKDEGFKAICGVLLTDVLTDGWTFVIVESLL